MRRGRPLVILLFTGLALLFVVTQALIPPSVAKQMHDALRTHIPMHEAIHVRLTSFPAFRIFAGWIDTAEIDIVRPLIGDLAFDRIVVRGHRVRLDVETLLAGALAIREADELTIEAVLNEASLTQHLQIHLPEVSDVRVALQDGAAVVYGGASILGRTVDIMVDGTVQLTGTDTIQFAPDKVTIEQQSVPKALVGAMAALWQWEIDLSGLPFPVRLSNVEVTEGRLLLRGVWRQGE